MSGRVNLPIVSVYITTFFPICFVYCDSYNKKIWFRSWVVVVVVGGGGGGGGGGGEIAMMFVANLVRSWALH